MLFEEVAKTSVAIAQTAGRKKKIALLAALLERVPVEERAIAARHLSGEVGHKLGVGYATVAELRGQAPGAVAASLTLAEVERRFAAIAAMGGSGSGKARKEAYGGLLAAATEIEQGFLGALVVGELRQGALDALVVDALALARGVEARRVRTAYMLAGDIGAVAAAVLADGEAGIARFGLTLFQPVLPMLAQTADDTAEALANLGGPLSLEHKLDGFRVQIHKDGDAIRAYSRALNDVTASIPDVIEAIRALPAHQLILDGEAIAYGPSGRPLPFQDTMKRKSETGGQLSLSIFDALRVDDQTLLATPARERWAAITALAPAHAVPRVITGDAAEAAAFYEDALARGHEGVMAKSLDAPYDAGSRGAAWLKIKKVRRLDFVVLAAEWGSGRRRGWLSNIHLGARDPATGTYVMLGKTFKGMTDAMLEWQTAQFLARELDRDAHIVFVRPEIVAEVAFNDVLRSTQYPGGLALRHARVVRYRDDKTAAEVDTIDAVRAIAIADGVV
ncbi:MAG: ATP-dependent DNA ligase [Deltaproteobacteria bacterium]|nr:ATP-dependent DNA ligase [Deltaproteobacteria bacterium]MDQ3300152.1 ATP-dependent DNA ligase [Myxococcota bacterium]